MSICSRSKKKKRRIEICTTIESFHGRVRMRMAREEEEGGCGWIDLRASRYKSVVPGEPCKSVPAPIASRTCSALNVFLYIGEDWLDDGKRKERWSKS